MRCLHLHFRRAPTVDVWLARFLQALSYDLPEDEILVPTKKVEMPRLEFLGCNPNMWLRDDVRRRVMLPLRAVRRRSNSCAHAFTLSLCPLPPSAGVLASGDQRVHAAAASAA